MDPRHGKRALPSDESQEKEEDLIFPVYSARSQQDNSAMVSALAQVIGSTETDPLHQFNQNPLTTSQFNATQQDQSQPAPQDQGILNTHTHK